MGRWTPSSKGQRWLLATHTKVEGPNFLYMCPMTFCAQDRSRGYRIYVFECSSVGGPGGSKLNISSLGTQQAKDVKNIGTLQTEQATDQKTIASQGTTSF